MHTSLVLFYNLAYLSTLREFISAKLYIKTFNTGPAQAYNRETGQMCRARSEVRNFKEANPGRLAPSIIYDSIYITRDWNPSLLTPINRFT